jgi:hypothetical protein
MAVESRCRGTTRRTARPAIGSHRRGSCRLAAEDTRGSARSGIRSDERVCARLSAAKIGTEEQRAELKGLFSYEPSGFTVPYAISERKLQDLSLVYLSDLSLKSWRPHGDSNLARADNRKPSSVLCVVS